MAGTAAELAAAHTEQSRSSAETKNGEGCGLVYLDLLQGVRPLAAGDNQMERAFLEVGAADWQWQPPMEQVC